MSKLSLQKQEWYYLTHSWRDKEAHTFPKDISLKLNVIERLEFELAYFEATVQHFSYYATGTRIPCIYPTLPSWAGCDSKLIFKWYSADLNLMLSFY